MDFYSRKLIIRKLEMVSLIFLFYYKCYFQVKKMRKYACIFLTFVISILFHFYCMSSKRIVRNLWNY